MNVLANLGTFQFAASQWLWALLAIPVVYGLFLLEQKRRQKRFESFAHRKVWLKIAPDLDWGAALRKARLWSVALTFLILALARPQWGVIEETVRATGLDIMFVLDVSNSMEVEDVIPSRLKKAKHLIRSFANRLTGDRVGVVAFAGGAYLSCPLTTDLDYMIEAVEVLSPRTVTNQGTDVGLALETAAKALDRGAEQSAGKNSENAASRVVILISDGEDNERKSLEGAQLLKDSGAKLFVLGVGTEKGGPIPVRTEEGQNVGFKRDRANQVVVSSFKPDALMQLASAAGGRYWSVTPYESEVEEVLQAMGALNRTEFAQRKYLIHEERFQFPLAIALLFLLLELSLSARKKSRATTGKVVGGLLFCALGGQVFSPLPAEAAPLRGYLENEKGLKAFQDGKTEEAQKRFGAAQALDPSLPEFQFNQGVVQMKQGDVEGAVQGFGGAARDSLKRNDQELAARSFYNLGNALTEKKDFQAAAQAYLSALESIQKSGSPSEIEKDVRKNLELLAQARERQKQQEKQEQDQDQEKEEGKEGESQDSKDSKESKDQKSDPKKTGQAKEDQAKKGKGKSEEPNEKSSYEDPSQSRQKFKSEKLSKEDADRVMAELSQREKKLQEKLKRQGARTRSLEKDW